VASQSTVAADLRVGRTGEDASGPEPADPTPVEPERVDPDERAEDAAAPASQPDRYERYLAGWMATTRLMHQGKSWSGHERDCVYLNLTAPGPAVRAAGFSPRSPADPVFADISAAVGLDFEDDGRCLAVTDWDGDGDLDLWYKNRTGPAVRFMLNTGTAGTHFIAFRLVGTTCNRDAIGARVQLDLPEAPGAADLRVGRRALVRSLRAGDGYLAQSSKWLHFGLGPADSIERVTITWPDGRVERFDAPTADRRYRVVQGTGALEPIPPRDVILRPRPTPKPEETGARIVLREPLPLPPSLLTALGMTQESSSARLVVLWANWCAPCLAELGQLAKDRPRLEQAGLTLLALNVDPPADRPKSLERFAEKVAPASPDGRFPEQAATPDQLELLDALLQHVRYAATDAWPLPAALLIGRQGTLEVLYLGPATPDRLATDTADYGLTARPAHQRFSFEGRWYYRTRRDFGGLADDLQRRGCLEEAAFYRALLEGPRGD